jgi:hypothetical protein
MRAIVVCFHCVALGIVSVGVECVEMGADSLDGSKILTWLIKFGLQHNESHTCVIPALVSRTLFCALSGSPAVLLVTGRASMISDVLS